MTFLVNLDLKKVEKALNLTKKKVPYIVRTATRLTARNMRVKISKADMGVAGGFRRKKVPRARVKPLVAKGAEGIWVGLNDVNASELKGRALKKENGITFRGKFYPGAFFGRFRNEKKRRILRVTPQGKVQELMIPIESEAHQFLVQDIQPEIPKRLEVNIGQAVDKLKYVKRGK